MSSELGEFPSCNYECYACSKPARIPVSPECLFVSPSLRHFVASCAQSSSLRINDLASFDDLQHPHERLHISSHRGSSKALPKSIFQKRTMDREGWVDSRELNVISLPQVISHQESHGTSLLLATYDDGLLLMSRKQQTVFAQPSLLLPVHLNITLLSKHKRLWQSTFSTVKQQKPLACNSIYQYSGIVLMQAKPLHQKRREMYWQTPTYTHIQKH